MVGFACRETPQFMPMSVVLAGRIARELTACRKSGYITGILPDGKAQVTVEYEVQREEREQEVEQKNIEKRGRQGSSSRNYDVLGRELLTPDEVRMMYRKKCLVIINGLPPVMDDKFVPFRHPMFDQTADGAGTPYVHGLPAAGKGTEPPFVLLSSEALEYYEEQKEKGGAGIY